MSETPAFYGQPSLNVATYDSQADLAVIAGDIPFYLELAAATPGPVLDLGGGTGRVAWPLAEAGHEVTTLELSSAMLAVSRAKATLHPPDVGARVSFVEADMRDFNLGQKFGLAIAPFRVFQLLLTPADQAAALEAIHRHLRPGGVFVPHLFDPLLELCGPMDEDTNVERGTGRIPGSADPVRIRSLHRRNDTLAQVLTERWEFAELASDGTVVRSEEEQLQMRWTYRHEMRYLLELSGFAVDAEYSDFHRSSPRYGAEQVWLTHRR